MRVLEMLEGGGAVEAGEAMGLLCDAVEVMLMMTATDRFEADGELMRFRWLPQWVASYCPSWYRSQSGHPAFESGVVEERWTTEGGPGHFGESLVALGCRVRVSVRGRLVCGKVVRCDEGGLWVRSRRVEERLAWADVERWSGTWYQADARVLLERLSVVGQAVSVLQRKGVVDAEAN